MGKAFSHTCDTQEQINLCLNCKHPECWGGCALMGGRHKDIKNHRGSKLDKDGIGRKLVAMGMTDKQIGEHVGLHWNSVAHWRRVNGIAPGHGSGNWERVG